MAGTTEQGRTGAPRLPGADLKALSRGGSAAGLGLACQVVLGLAAALVAMHAQSWAVAVAAWSAFAGAAVWGVILIAYREHRSEMVDAREAERLAEHSEQAARLFEEGDRQLEATRSRLRLLYRWGMPLSSAVAGVYLVGAGLWLARSQWGRVIREDGSPANYLPLQEAAFGNAEASGAIVGAGLLAAAFVGFLVARATAGMTRSPAWMLLRGGASQLMGLSALLALLAVGAFAWSLGAKGWMSVVSVAAPLLVALSGLEALVWVVLGVYRPVRPGEAPRPAFDSRLLGLLARPESLSKIFSETLRYQFGVDFSSSWAFRMAKRAAGPLVVMAVGLLVASSSLVVVDTGRQAVVTVNGGSPKVVGPGLHVKWPWPVGEARQYNVDRVRSLEVGSVGDGLDFTKAFIWTNDDHTSGEEEYLITAPTAVSDSGDPELLAGGDDGDGPSSGRRILQGEYTSVKGLVTWRIEPEGGLLKYVRASRQPEELVRLYATEALTAYAAGRTIDDLIGLDRLQAGRELQAGLQARLDATPGGEGLEPGLGIEVVAYRLVAAHPPVGEVAEKFHEQVSALQGQKAEIAGARADEAQTLSEAAGSRREAEAIAALFNERDGLSDRVSRGETLTEEESARLEALPGLIAGAIDRAGGEAARLIVRAEAERTRLVQEAEARASRFPVQARLFASAPGYYPARLLFLALAGDEGMANSRKVVDLSGTEGGTVRFELEDPAPTNTLGGGPR
ncbi:MAG: SPFH domain-containing protein [Planctomycetota bacterium]